MGKLMKIQAFLATVAILAFSIPAQAGFISAVTKAGGNDRCVDLDLDGSHDGGCPDMAFVPLEEGVLVRNDRTHTFLNIPSELMEDNATQPDEIAEMIKLSNSDKDSGDVVHNVTLSRLSVLYVGIDNRQFDGSTDEVQDMQYSWMSDLTFTGLPGAFVNTGQFIGIDENGDGEANQNFTLFATIAPAGTYQLGAHEGGGNNMYIALADDHVLTPTIPEPSSIVLVLTSLFALGIVRRK